MMNDGNSVMRNMMTMAMMMMMMMTMVMMNDDCDDALYVNM
jgi:hypothetical protein